MISSTTGGYDLFETVEIEKVVREKGKKAVHTGEYQTTDSLLGYNMSVQTCIHRIVEIELHHNKDVMPLKEAVKLWNDKYNEIKEHIKF